MDIYLFIADGDPSLDAGYLAERIGRCCEQLGDPHGAKWWYGRAVEENTGIPAYVEARRRLDGVTINSLLAPLGLHRPTKVALIFPCPNAARRSDFVP